MRRTHQVFFQLRSSDSSSTRACALLAVLGLSVGVVITGGCEGPAKTEAAKPTVVDDKGNAVDLAPWLRRPLTRTKAKEPTETDIARIDPRLDRDPATRDQKAVLGMDLLRAAADGTLDSAAMRGEQPGEWTDTAGASGTSEDPMGLGLEAIARDQASASRPTRPVAPASNAVGTNSWTIVLGNAKGEGARENATQLLEQVRELGVTDAYVEERGAAWVVATGAFDAPSSPAALEAVARVRAIESNGDRPFSGAVVSPPLGDTQGTRPEWDLRNAKAQHGRRAVFTMQIAVYQTGDASKTDDKAMTEIRRAAEQAVVQLRREGEEAFYYHGPIRSSVTVGLFDDKDYIYQKRVKDVVMVLSAPEETAKVTNMRRKYPYNLVNGAQYMVKRPQGDKAYPQASLVVPVPDK